MKLLGKVLGIEPLLIPVPKLLDTYILGGRTYEVKRDPPRYEGGPERWYLSSVGKSWRVPNDEMFRDLGTSKDLWLSVHGIEKIDAHGVFPYLTREDLGKAIAYLKQDFKKRDLLYRDQWIKTTQDEGF